MAEIGIVSVFSYYIQRPDIIMHYCDVVSWALFSYCARFIGSSWSHLVLAAGTVFNQVVLWSPDDGQILKEPDGQDAKVLHRLTGHQVDFINISHQSTILNTHVCKSVLFSKPLFAQMQTHSRMHACTHSVREYDDLNHYEPFSAIHCPALTTGRNTKLQD